MLAAAADSWGTAERGAAWPGGMEGEKRSSSLANAKEPADGTLLPCAAAVATREGDEGLLTSSPA